VQSAGGHEEYPFADVLRLIRYALEVVRRPQQVHRRVDGALQVGEDVHDGRQRGLLDHAAEHQNLV
jgi:hypothetical protein